MTMIGCTRCSIDRQDLTAQRQALAAARDGDTLVCTKLDRLARSVPDALAILDQLAARNVRLSLGGTVHDWADPFGRMFLQILAVVAEFEVNLLRQRTREGMTIARARGKPKGRKPKLTGWQDKQLAALHGSGEHTVSELAAMFGISRPAVYWAIERVKAA